RLLAPPGRRGRRPGPGSGPVPRLPRRRRPAPRPLRLALATPRRAVRLAGGVAPLLRLRPAGGAGGQRRPVVAAGPRRRPVRRPPAVLADPAGVDPARRRAPQPRAPPAGGERGPALPRRLPDLRLLDGGPVPRRGRPVGG